MFSHPVQSWVRRQAQALAERLAKSPVTPNQLTVVGMLMVFVAGALVGFGQLLAGGIVLAAGAVFDIFDGALARVTGRSHPYGAFLDSTTDRYAEAAVYVGLAAYYVSQPNSRLALLGVMLALVGSFSVSYVRARAQSLGFKCESGLFARPERIVATIVGLLFGGWVLLLVVWALALLTNFTALQRVREVWLQARERRSVVLSAAEAEPPAPVEPVAPVELSRPARPRTKLARQPEA